jgi:predicted DCC family thiol-disulfide oxidoreductase YuxK
MTSAARRRGSGTLVFDGDCGFCTTSAGWAGKVAPGVDIVAYQLTDLDRLGVTEEAAAAEVQYVDKDGRVSGGAAAIARLLVSRGGLFGVLGRVMLLPGIRSVAAWVYKKVADNRYRLPGGTPACRVTN